MLWNIAEAHKNCRDFALLLQASGTILCAAVSLTATSFSQQKKPSEGVCASDRVAAAFVHLKKLHLDADHTDAEQPASFTSVWHWEPEGVGWREVRGKGHKPGTWLPLLPFVLLNHRSEFLCSVWLCFHHHFSKMTHLLHWTGL